MRFRKPGGNEYLADIYPDTRRVPRAEVTHVYATLGWTGHEWIIINLYPSKLPHATTVVQLTKSANHGRPTL